MSASAFARPATFTVRGVQIARAAFAAIAAVMITFSPDHSAQVGLAVFSGFAIATGLTFVLGAWLAYPGRRIAPALLGGVSLGAGMVGGMTALRSTMLFLILVISWAFITGIIELVWGLRERRSTRVARAESRDAITLGALSILLAIALLFVSPDYALQYVIDGFGASTLTGSTIAVGVFGGYAAIIAVFLGIAAFSPRPSPQSTPAVDQSAAAPTATKERG